MLFRNRYWKIADFGLTSKGTSKNLVTTNAARGKECYRAPELLRDSESGYNNKSDIWSFGCIAYELFTGRKPFSNDFEVWQYGVTKRSPKMYFKGLDDLTKHYIYGLLEVDPVKRPSARTLLKERFLTKRPSTNSLEAARAQKRRRTSFAATAPSLVLAPLSLFKGSLDWAASNRQIDLILVLVEAGVKPVGSLEVCRILEAFHAVWNDSSYSKLGRLFKLYQPSFWRIHVPGVPQWKAGVTAETNELEFYDLRKSRNTLFVSWSVPQRPFLHFDDWYAICITGMFDISHFHTERLQAEFFVGNDCQFSADGKFLAAGGNVYKVNVASHITKSPLTALSDGIDLENFSRVKFTHDSSRLVVAYWDGPICVWDLATKEIILELDPQTPSIVAIDVSRDDTRLVGVGMDKFTLWSLETGKIIDDYRLPGKTLYSVAISTDGQFAVAGGGGGDGYVWRFDQRWREINLHGHQDRLISIACSHGKPGQVISGSWDGTIKLWMLPSTESSRGNVDKLDDSVELPIECEATMTGHEARVSAVAFSPDEKWIASGSWDGSVRLWDIMDGTLALLLYGRLGSEG